MNAESLLAHYGHIADAPDAIARLRRFILDLSVRGKLVPQDPNDEPASELLKRIATEKARLVKAGKIGKLPSLEPIHDAETPHALPPSWAWVRVGDIFDYDAGIKRDPKELSQERWLLELEDIEKDTSRIVKRVRVSDRDSQSTKSEFEIGDILYGKLRPYLNKVVVADEWGYSTTEIVAIRPFLKLCSEYCALAFRRPDFVSYVERLGRGTKMPRLRTPDAIVAMFPLPPLAEQRRIVTKVDELMALCDRLEAARISREEARDRFAAATFARLNARDPEAFQRDARFALHALAALTTRPDQIKAIRQTILNLAVRGKLVPQDESNEPASELLTRIAKEKAQLIKEGKVKRQDPLTEVNLDQSPFELPPGWGWARFPELGTFGRGKSKHRPRNDPALFDGGEHLLIQTGDVARSRGIIETYTGKYNDFGLSQSLKWPKGTLCITIAANIADSGILSFDACFPDSVVGFIPASMFGNARYFEYFVRTAKDEPLGVRARDGAEEHQSRNSDAGSYSPPTPRRTAADRCQGRQADGTLRPAGGKSRDHCRHPPASARGAAGRSLGARGGSRIRGSGVSITATFLHSRPQREIASIIRSRLAGCRTAEIVSGFATPDGVDALRAKSVSSKIKRFVLGAGTFKAFEALDGLISSGLPSGAARVHLGHTRATGGRKHPFARYRPMLHSKIYFFEMPDGTTTAFIGSHNLTGFALRGLNGEASVLLEGASSDPVFDEVRGHIAESFRQAVPYDPSLKAAYAQWLRDYLEQLGIDATDMPRDDEGTRTVILFAEAPQGRMPAPGDRIYFELDMRITEVNSINTEVHLHLFAAVPATPAEALSRSVVSDTALLCKVEAIDSAAGSAEVKADWFIDDPTKPQLKPAVQPFRPTLSPGKQQVRALVSKSLELGFDYLFDAGKGDWVPTLGDKKIRDEETNVVWSAVAGLRESGPVDGPLLLSDLRETSPESGSFVLFSRRRRRLGVRKNI